MNGAAGVVVTRDGRACPVLGFTFRLGRTTAMEVLAVPAPLRWLDLAGLDV